MSSEDPKLIQILNISLKNTGDIPTAVSEYITSLKKKEGKNVEVDSILPKWKSDYTHRLLNQVFFIPGEESLLLSITDDGSSKTKDKCSLEICVNNRGKRYRILYKVASFDYNIIQ